MKGAMMIGFLQTIKSMLVRGFILGVRFIVGMLGKSTSNFFCTTVAGWMDSGFVLNTKYGALSLFSPGEYTTIRAETFFTKEPETLEWIDSLGTEDILWDIGANVGCYSLYAAKKGMRVYSFEPAFTNFFVLNKNIALNGLDRRITAYCVSLSDEKAFGQLHMSNTMMGAALNQYSSGEDSPIDKHGENSFFLQGTQSISIDGLTSEYPELFPNHIKIDVDGIEERILNGALQTLRDVRLKSVSIEVEEDDQGFVDRVINIMATAGLELTARRHGDMYDTGNWAHVYNYVFRRRQI